MIVYKGQLGSRHALGDHRLIELHPREHPELERGFRQSRAFFERSLRNLRRAPFSLWMKPP